jgi:hypothetical protein
MRFRRMTKPIIVDIPHELGRARARERIDQGADQIAAILPGSVVRASRWDGDTKTFTLESFGQQIDSRFEVFETHVLASVDLPSLRALAAEKMRGQLRATGKKLLR